MSPPALVADHRYHFNRRRHRSHNLSTVPPSSSPASSQPQHHQHHHHQSETAQRTLIKTLFRLTHWCNLLSKQSTSGACWFSLSSHLFLSRLQFSVSNLLSARNTRRRRAYLFGHSPMPDRFFLHCLRSTLLHLLHCLLQDCCRLRQRLLPTCSRDPRCLPSRR